MRFIFLTIFIFCAIIASAQFSVIVEANPDNHGEVSSHWVNNYVVRVKIDGKINMLIRNQQTWSSLDGSYKVSYFEKKVFKEQTDAIKFAKQFTDKTCFFKYDAEQLRLHNYLNNIYEQQNKNITVAAVKNKKPDPVVVYSSKP